MPVPQELMQQMMAAGKGQGGAPAMPPGQGGGMQPQGGAMPASPPQAAPLNQPQDKAGLKSAAMVNLHIALNMLEEAVPAFGAESKEGQKLLGVMKSLGQMVSRKDSSDLVPAEILRMVRQLPQMGGGTDVQRVLLQQMSQAGKPQQQQPQNPQQ